MACQELQSGLSPNARPQGGLDESGRPQGGLGENARQKLCGSLCRSFDFSGPASGNAIVTFVILNPMGTFAGNSLVTF